MNKFRRNRIFCIRKGAGQSLGALLGPAGRRLAVTALSLCMIVSLMPLAVFAQTEEIPDPGPPPTNDEQIREGGSNEGTLPPDNGTESSQGDPEHSHEGYTAVGSDGGSLEGNYYLNGDVELTNSITVESSKTLHLCLNGQTLSASKSNAISVEKGGTLYLTGCGTDESKGTISVTGSYRGLFNDGTTYLSDVDIASVDSYGISNNEGTLYLSGKPSITGGTNYAPIVIYTGKLYAHDGGENRYSGGDLTLHFTNYSSGQIAVYGVTDDNKEKFKLKDTNYEFKEVTAATGKNLVVHGLTKNLTWQNGEGNTLEEDSYPKTAEYGSYIYTLPTVPPKENSIAAGWLYSTDDGTTWSSVIWKTYDKIKGDTIFKPLYVASFAGGNGTSTPYQISTPEQLQALAVLVNCRNTDYNKSSVHYELTADINLSSLWKGETKQSWTPIGNNSNPFMGSLDGSGHTISNLYINNAEGLYQGLFGYLSGSSCEVKNLTLTGVDITGDSYVGAVAGYVSGASVTGCTVSGDVTGSKYFGAVVGRLPYGTEEKNVQTGCKTHVLGYTDNGIMAFKIDEEKNTIDVKGFYKGEWIQTTFNNKGYEVAWKDINPDQITKAAAFTKDGRYVRLTYTVEAGETAINGKLAVHADIMIGANDRAAIETIRDEDGKVIGIKMVDDDGTSSTHDAQFNLRFADADGVTKADTHWFGHYSDRVTNNYEKCFLQLADGNKSTNWGVYTKVEDVFTKYSDDDSGMAFSWNVKVDANTSKTYSVILGVGERSDPPAWVEGANSSPISLTLDADQSDLVINVSAKIAHVDNVKSELFYKIDGGTGTSLGQFEVGKDEDSISKKLDLSSLKEDPGNHTLGFWVVNEKGALSTMLTKTITIENGKITKGLDEITAKVEKKGEETPDVTVSEKELIAGVFGENGPPAGTEGTKTKIDVSLIVEKTEEPVDKDVVKSRLEPNQTVGVYLDIELKKTTTVDEGEPIKETVTDAQKEITITVTIPEAIRDGSNYQIIRVHKGIATLIEPITHNPIDHTLTFKTDKFSTYAIVYEPEGGYLLNRTHRRPGRQRRIL